MADLAAPGREPVRGESRWPAAVAVLAASGLQMTLPRWLAFAPHWLLPGPADRCYAVRAYPDFLFPQMQQPGLAPSAWKPLFTDYLYLSFTNAISFAASDVPPLTRWAKTVMMLQSAISVAAIALVVARAVNILG